MMTYLARDDNGKVGVRGEDNKPVKRTKEEFPWSYDGFVTWLSPSQLDGEEQPHNSIYTDRLRMWDKKKLKKLRLKHFGEESDYWSDFEPKDIEAFLRDWCDDSGLTLEMIMQYCNVATGYPLWCLIFNYGEKNDKEANAS